MKKITVYFIFEEKLGLPKDKLYKITESLEEANNLVKSPNYWSKAVTVELPLWD